MPLRCDVCFRIPCICKDTRKVPSDPDQLADYQLFMNKVEAFLREENKSSKDFPRYDFLNAFETGKAPNHAALEAIEDLKLQPRVH